MGMKVDIQPQWKRIADWYWEGLSGHEGTGMSIWKMLEHDYGVRKIRHHRDAFGCVYMIVEFPDEQTYTAFLLRWA